MGSSTNKDSDSISLKDAMQTDSSVDPIEKEEYSNVTHPFNNPNQNIASSTDKSEKGNNPEVLFAVDSKCSEIGTTRDWINADRIENREDVGRWICKNIGIIENVTPDVLVTPHCNHIAFSLTTSIALHLQDCHLPLLPLIAIT